MRRPEAKAGLSYCVVHNGCDPLEADAAGVRRELENMLGLRPALAEEADVLVYMACTFSRQKEEEFERTLTDFCRSSNGRLVIASGCYLRDGVSHPNLKYCRTDAIVKVVSNALDLPQALAPRETPRSKAGTGIVVISEGCYGCCAFCSVKLVRGQHRSRPLQEVLDDIGRIWHGNGSVKLAGQDVGAYGRDQGNTLWGLLTAASERFPGLKVELGPLGPEWLIKSATTELTRLGSASVTGNIHVPLQSASDNVLNKMRRHYSYDEFNGLWARLCEVGVQNISTDLMAGFPGETQDDHEETLGFLRTHNLAFAQIFMYEPRPGTEAERYNTLSKRTRVKRTMELIAEYLHASARFRAASVEELISATDGMLFNTNVQIQEDLTDEG